MVDFLKLLKMRMSDIYFIMIFTVLTFYMHNGYYDTLQAKGIMLRSISFFYVLTMLIAYVFLLAVEEKKKWIIWKQLNAMDWGLLIFSGLGCLSTIFSEDKKTAFFGGDGCMLGSFVIFLLCLSSIFLSKNVQLSRSLLMVVILSGYVVFAWGITNCFGLDFMNWYENMSSNPYDFLSTIGNRDWYVGYLALMLPFVAVLFLYEREKRVSICYTVYIFLGFINLYITKGDGNLLVFGCAIPLVYCSLKNLEIWKRFIQLLWIFILSSFTVDVICVFVNPLHVTGDSILGTLQKYHWYLGLSVITLILQMAGERIVSLHLERVWLTFSVLVIIGMFIGVILYFDGSFGSNRGYIWTYTVKTYAESGFWQKLIGWGPDCFRNAVYSITGNDIYVTWPEDNQIANAHNEILQYLITMGITGMISYLAMFVLAFVRVIKRRGMLRIAAGTAIFAYFCTALGNNPQPLNYGILFAMFAIINMEERKDYRTGVC